MSYESAVAENGYQYSELQVYNDLYKFKSLLPVPRS